MDSSSEEEAQPTSTLDVQKQSRTMPPAATVPAAFHDGRHASSQMPPLDYWGPSPWMHPQWMPPPMQSRPWHSGEGHPPPPHPNSWPGPIVSESGLSPESATRDSRRRKRQRNDLEAVVRSTGGKKPHQLVVKVGGEIDLTCDGKTSWDNAVRVATPRILDMSVVDWEAQKPASIALLREALEKDFEYVGHTLSMQGFRSAIKKYLKAERARLKSKFVSGKETCPVHIDPMQWERLQVYWKTELQVSKTAKMVHARAHVKDYSTMGRRGRAGKELAVREGKEQSPGLTEIAEGMQEMQQNGSITKSAAGAVRDRLLVLEEHHNEIVAKHTTLEGKMTQMLQNQSENSHSMEEMKSMLKKVMERFSSIEGFNPSIGISTQSTVDTQAQLGSRKQQVIPASSNTPLKMSAPVQSMLCRESSSDSDTVKPKAPTLAKVKDHTPLVPKGPLNAIVKEFGGNNNNTNLASIRTLSAVAALVHLEGLAPQVGISTKDDVVDPVEDEVVGMDNMQGVQEEVVNGIVAEEVVESTMEKVVPPQSSALESKRLLPARNTRRIVASNKEESHTVKKGVDTVVVVELSASVSPVGPAQPIRTSPRKQKVLLKSPAEGSTKHEENLVKPKSNRRQTRAKATPPKKPEAEKYAIGQEVYLLNPKNTKQSVAAGMISGVGGLHKFHFVTIPDHCYKVDVTETIWPNIQLQFPNPQDDQTKLKDVLGCAALWEGKFIRAAK